MGCFSGMGFHAFRDTESGAKLSYEPSRTEPVVAMYDYSAFGGRINAIFFTVPFREQSLFPPSTNEWEPVPLTNSMQCANLCDGSACAFDAPFFWSTMHLYFRDYKRVTCPNDCEISCCPK